MTQVGGWAQVWTAVSSALVSAVPAEVRAEQHLATEAVVAYVDGELSIAAHDRATRHLSRCTQCTAEVAAQLQARTAVRNAAAPSMPASLLAALHAIPHSAELPPGPDELSIDENGRFVVAQRPLTTAAPLGLSAPLGSGERLGSGALLGATPPPTRSRSSRRIRGGAGVVATGLVLGALALTAPSEPTVPGAPRPGADTGGSQPVTDAPAHFDFAPRTDRPLITAGLAQR